MAASLHTLKNGLKVVLVPCEAESVAFGLFIASGSRHETPKTAGISHFIEHMLFKGTPTRSPLDITRSIEGRGGNFNACTGEESTSYYAHMPSEYLGEAIEIISDMYLNATIPEEEFAREKSVVIEEIKMYADEPDAVAMENLQAALFPNHPLGLPVAGSERSISPMSADKLRSYKAVHYRPERTIAVVVGAFDPGEALKLVERTLGAYRAKGKWQVACAPRLEACVPEVTALKADVSQAQLALGYRAFGIADQRKYAAVVMDAILGRGMSSRLFQEVREKRGLSYDISSRLQFFSDTGMFTVTAGLDPANCARALATIDRELERISMKKVPARELSLIKDFVIGNFRLSHEKITSKLFYYGNTMLSFGRLIAPSEQIDAVRGVSADDILAVSRDILKPENRAVSRVLPKED